MSSALVHVRFHLLISRLFLFSCRLKLLFSCRRLISLMLQAQVKDRFLRGTKQMQHISGKNNLLKSKSLSRKTPFRYFFGLLKNSCKGLCDFKKIFPMKNLKIRVRQFFLYSFCK